MSVSYWQDETALQKSKRVCDVAIIGGGIAGFSTAYWLKREDPALKVVVIEKGDIGAGATGRNAGFITCGSVEHFNRLCERWGRPLALEMWNFSEENLRLLREHIIQDHRDLEFEDDGTFSLASTEAELRELTKTMELMRDSKIEVETLDAAALSRRLGVENFVGGIKYLRDASVHPLKLLHKISAAAGVETLVHTEVFDLQVGEGTTLVRTQRGLIEAGAVVLATNAYSATLAPYFAEKIMPTRGQILVTEPVAPFMEGPCYANFVLDYFRQLQDGRVLIGGFRQLEKATEVGYSDHTTERIQNSLYEFLQTYIPRLRNLQITHRWGGVMGFSFDGQPLIGSLPDQPQTYFVGGFTGHGMGLAFHCAKVLVDLMYGREIPAFLSAKRAP